MLARNDQDTPPLLGSGKDVKPLLKPHVPVRAALYWTRQSTLPASQGNTVDIYSKSELPSQPRVPEE